jgi:hypothetical protein
MEEIELERRIRDLQGKYGLLGFHCANSRGSVAGFPDWVIVGRAVLFRELKSAYGDTSTPQRAWGFALIHAGADYGIWRPGDLASGRIERELAAIRLR